MFLVDRGYKWLERHKKHILGVVLVSVLTVSGVLDQTTTTFFFIPEYKKIEVEYRSDAEFVSRIESSLPNGAMVFQLPYMTFPENGPLHRITQDFELVKPYLHSTKLRWSYGAINADYYDTWQRDVVVKPVPEFIDEIVANGFSGLYINRNGYADSAVSLEAELKTLLGAGPITNSDGTLLFFSLANYSSQKK
jgi:phosphoglycerol transferase